MDNKNKEFVPNLESTRQQLKHLLDIPNTFTILLMQGDLATQRTGICYNLLADKKSVNVLNTGKHSEQAKIEISKHATAVEVASSESSGRITLGDDWQVEKTADVFHYCDAEPQEAFEFQSFPDGKIPENSVLVADMSLSLTQKQVDWSKFGVVYADATKQFGIKDLVIVIVRSDLLGKQKADTPSHLNWQAYNDNPADFSKTPTTWQIYLLGINIEYLTGLGGVTEISARARARSDLFHSLISQSGGVFSSPVDKKFRSKSNVLFRIGQNNEALE